MKNRTSQQSKKRSAGKMIFCFLRRTLLVLLVAVGLVVAAAAMACNAIFNGPSQEAREKLFYCFYEPSGTKWVPGLFLTQEQIDEIKNRVPDTRPSSDVSGQVQIQINTDTSLNGENNEWKDYPDGIRIIQDIKGDTYTAHLMIIRDPSRVYLGTSASTFDGVSPGIRITDAMKRDAAVAGVNGGAFWDNGTSDPKVSTIPEGLVFSKGKQKWNRCDTFWPSGFAGFTEDNVLVVANSMSAEKAKQLKIRDGCAFGPVLIIDGQVNSKVYNSSSGLNPRTCIAQRADGAVIFLCIDGRQATSMGGSYADCIDILVEYGAVNAYNLDGGSSSAMMYQDTYGRYGEVGEVLMINNYSLLQTNPRKMPTFFLVAPIKEGN